MVKPLLLLAASIGVAIWLGLSLYSIPDLNSPTAPAITDANPPDHSLMVYCAASNRAVMECIAGDYEQEFSIPIQFQFGPSQTLLSSIEVTGTGDLYLPADASYLKSAVERQLVTDVIPLARMQVVLGVARGNPLGIARFEDLLKPGCRVIQANPELAAVGKLTRDELTRQGKWNSLQTQTSSFVSSVTEAANSISVGAGDIAIVYDAVLANYSDLEAVSITEFNDLFADVAVGIIATSRQASRAKHFAQYLGAADRGLKRYAEFGFAPVAASPWAGAPLP